MSDMSISLSGLDVALKAIETIGNNIANASTPGYHRQEVEIVPMPSSTAGGVSIGGGAQVVDVRRFIDQVLEAEIFRQQPLMGQVQTELGTLRSVEGILGNLSTEGASAALNNFFNSLTQLASQPESAPLRDQAVWAADVLASQFRNLSAGLDDLNHGLDVEVSATIDQANGLIDQIADLNAQIRESSVRSPDNNLLDRRDEAVSQLAALLDIQVQDGGSGTVIVRSGGMSLVGRGGAAHLEAGTTPGGLTGIAVAGTKFFDATISGGSLGALLALKNTILPDVRDALDATAQQVIQRINQEHVQGVGTAGPFSRLVGGVADEDLSAWNPPLAAGTFYMRITNAATGAVSRAAVAVDPSSADPAKSTLSGIAGQIDALTGVRASVASSQLRIEAEDGYRFDFQPAILPTPAENHLTGSAQPTISGLYTGATNQVLTAQVVGTGQVGVTSGLALKITDGNGNVLTTLNVGAGYAAGDVLEVADGVRLAFSAGDLNDGETFTVQALADSDTSGFLAGAGLNVFFRGNSAGTIEVADELLSDSSGLATSLGAAGTDNAGALRMAAVGDAKIESLGGVTIGDYFRRLVADVGQQVAVRQARQEGLQKAAQQLAIQRDDISGTDINEEAAKLMVFQQMFQSMAKYLAVVESTTKYLFDTV
jgi:flagellar hook-associated protein FlgK